MGGYCLMCIEFQFCKLKRSGDLYIYFIIYYIFNTTKLNI